MAGWIKLWRKLTENGHFKLPGTAFKLWIYCLLEAAPYPDPKQVLAAGELWLSYRGIRENLIEDNKNVSMSTISAALKYLEEHGYILLQREKFKALKATVVNWGEYQSSDKPAPKSAAPRPATLLPPANPGAAAIEREFGRPLSPIELSQLSEWQQTYSPELIAEALARASLQNKRSIAYIGGILKNWGRKNLTTPETARHSQKLTAAQGGKTRAKRKAGYHPGEVDWASEPDTL